MAVKFTWPNQFLSNTSGLKCRALDAVDPRQRYLRYQDVGIEGNIVVAYFVGGLLLARLTAMKAQLPLDVVEKVLAAQNQVLLSLTDEGAKVRVLDGAGYFFMITKRATRRNNPQTGEVIPVPAQRKLAFKLSRRKK
jgi:nucleoid DNA-binding protein